MFNHEIRILTPADVEAYRTLRLEALQIHPDGFGVPYKDEVGQPGEFFAKRLRETVMFGSFVGQALVGIAGFKQETCVLRPHRGEMLGVYVRPEFRGHKLGDALVSCVIDYARARIWQLHCVVMAHYAPAVALYKKYGFEIYGTMPTALYVDGHYYDAHLMVLKFPQAEA